MTAPHNAVGSTLPVLHSRLTVPSPRQLAANHGEINAFCPRFTGWKVFWAISTLVVAMAVVILLLHQDLAEGLRAVIRATARTSFLLFLTAFVASSMAILVPAGFTQKLLKERRYLGLSFAFSHLVHLMAIVTYGVINPEFWPGRSALTNAPGTLGYTFILLMSATSFRAISRHMTGTAWKRLHTTGMWVIAAVFAYSFFKRIPTMGAYYAIPFGILCAAIAVRLIGKWAQGTKRKQRLRSSLRERATLAAVEANPTSADA